MKKFYLLFSLLCTTAMCWAQVQPRLATEYCQTSMGGDVDHGAAAGFTWETNDAGDVVITLSEVDGGAEGTTNFRNTNKTGNGMCEASLNKFHVGGASAADFFERDFAIGSQVYTLKLKDGVTAPALGTIITFNGFVEYETSVNKDCWPDLSFTYTYGSKCANLSQPTNVAVADNIITFDPIPNATSVKAFVYWRGDLCYVQEVVNGGILNFTPRIASTYQVIVQAYGENDAFSPASDVYNWVIDTGTHGGYAPLTSILNYPIQDGSNEESQVLVTWATNLENGDLEVTIAPQEGCNPENIPHTYWWEDGLRLSGFTFNGENTFSNYFDAEYYQGKNVPEGTTKLLFHPKTSGESIPIYGDIIRFSGAYVIYRYKENTHVWPTKTFPEFVYGTNTDVNNDHVAPVIEITEISSTFSSVTLQVDVTEKNDEGADCSLRSFTIRDDVNGYPEEAVVLNNENQITLSGLAYNTTYHFTVKVEDEGSNITEETIEVVLPFNTELNLALGRGEYCSAGATQDANTANKAVDGNLETFWTSYATGEEPTWWTVDLGVAYVVTDVKITFNDINAPYNIYASVNNTNWIPVVEGATANNGESKDHSDLTLAARYFKVTSTNRNFGIKEFEVYGTAFAAADAIAPEVTVTEKAKTVTSVTLQIDATDKDDAGEDGVISAIHISGNNDFETQSNVSLNGSNQITLSGLKDNKTYTFTVHVLDLAGNETNQNIEVELPFNTNYNIALDGTATAGYCENDAQTADKANDGNNETKWNTYGVETSKEEYVGTYANNWWKLELDAAYNLSSVVANYQDVGTKDFVIEGSMDGANWYLLYKGTTTTTGEFTYNVSAPARYVRYTYGERYLAVYEFEVYASGFSTLTDTKPVITYTALGEVTDVTAEIEIDAVDMTTKPITKYMVSGLGGDAGEVTASEGKITLTGLSQSTHYTASIQAKDESGNLSDEKQVEFTTVGSASGLYFFSDYFNWGDKAQDRARFSTTAEPGVLKLTIANMTAGDHNFKLYNADADRCTWDDCEGFSDHHIYNATAEDVTIYATSEDQFITTLDQLYLRGTLVGEEDQALEWNDTHTKATWRGALDLTGTKEFTVVKKNEVNETPYTYDQDFFASVQTFDGDYTYGEFTLDVTKMTGTWDYVGLSFADDAENENSTIIATYADKQANVTLNRNILADGTWYTLCLPFDMSAEKVVEVFGESTIAELASAEDHGSLISLKFDYVHAIEAGKAYLIKAGNNLTAGTVIPNVQIKNVAPIVSVAKEGETDLMHFQGTYNQITLRGSNIRFVADDDYLYSPNSTDGTLMGAFRCYFTIPTGSPASAPGKRARIVMGEQTATGNLSPSLPSREGVKILRDGQLYMMYNGTMYNVQGAKVRE